MHHTLYGTDALNDTQPDSQMHKDYLDGIFSASDARFVARGPTSLFTEQEQDDEDNVSSIDELEVAESSQQRNHTIVTSPTVVDFYDHPHLECKSVALTSPLKFDTPALVGRRGDSSAEIFSSAVRTNITPSTVASASAFGLGLGNRQIAEGQFMSLTQAWHNTQAPTSPAIGRVSEDPVFTRPSPNFTNIRHSSPIPAFSSPIKAVRPETPRSEPLMRSSSEPRAEYVTMEESQKKRDLEKPSSESVIDAEQDSWNDLSRQARARKANEISHHKAAKSLSRISAPMLKSLRPKGNSERNSRRFSPRKARRPGNITRISSIEEEEEEEDSMDEIIQPLQTEDDNEKLSSDASSQCILSIERISTGQGRDNGNVQVPKTSSHPHQTPPSHSLLEASLQPSAQPSPSSQMLPGSQRRVHHSQQFVRSAFQPYSSRECVAVMDSQCDINVNNESISQPKSIRFPSSPSINQYSINLTTMATRTGYTSQIISSSVPRIPPKYSANSNVLIEEAVTANEERVPSSPPLPAHDESSRHDDQIVYDEHTYDEYVKDGVEEEIISHSVVDKDESVGEDEDLPIAWPEPEDKEIDDMKSSATDEEVGPDLIHSQQTELEVDQEALEIPEPEHHGGGYDRRNTFEDELPIDSVEPSHLLDSACRNTVPETDALDETQPSFFPKDGLFATPFTDRDNVHQMSSANDYQTICGDLSVSKNNVNAPSSSRGDGNDSIQASNRIRSLSDVHNLPDIQQFHDEEEIEMPRLSGLDEDEVSPGYSPKRPAAKKRKITPVAKRSAFYGLPELANGSNLLSNHLPFLSGHSQVKLETEARSTGSLVHRDGRKESSHSDLSHCKPMNRLKYLNPPLERKGALKSVTRQLLQSLSSPTNLPSKAKSSTVHRVSTPTTPSRSHAKVHARKGDAPVPAADSELDELADTDTRSAGGEISFKDPSNNAQSAANNILVPNRVFAPWPGDHYYPATCMGRPSIRQLRIRFDDGNVTSLDAASVRALDLRRGDHVKVDAKGMKKHTYIVVGFRDRVDDIESGNLPLTDRLGFATVILEEKRGESLSLGKKLLPTEHICVPITNIYLPSGLWARLRDRPFIFSHLESTAKSAPISDLPVAEAPTLSSFTHRGTVVLSHPTDITFRAASVASTIQAGSGIFSRMAFVLTSTAASVDKKAISQSIKRNGGIVLEQGLHDLFEHKVVEQMSPQSRQRSVSEEPAELVPKNVHGDLGFVALISDAHSRSTKYIQALALNIPCLHRRWVDDSLSASRALPFPKYLLPAGVSKFLNPSGVIRSRTMNAYDPASDDMSFTQTVRDRDFLLHNQTVLIVTGKSKKEIEKRRPFIFLMHALGAANVRQCIDLVAASLLLRDGKWDWIYVDNGEKGVTEAASKLFSTGKAAHGSKVKKSKKRKRDESTEEEQMVVGGNVSGRTVRIISSEFVIQSLILGSLIDQ